MHGGVAPEHQPAGNFYDKYRTTNPIARWLMSGFLHAFDSLVSQATGSARALEIGCGEGELAIRIVRAGLAAEGCDIASEAVDEARRRAGAAGLEIAFLRCSIDEAPKHYAPVDLVVCCEVLEHLTDPERALDILARLSARYVLVSVPREPLWRALNLARLRYVTALGNTPGHVQHWSRRQFLRLLKSKFDVVAVRSPLPWTLALCRVRC
jgi:2-polyprenyl-3-methyl-5-hydroxy-6-metoxy-1,4-benzoquinol methylase